VRCRRDEALVEVYEILAKRREIRHSANIVTRRTLIAGTCHHRNFVQCKFSHDQSPFDFNMCCASCAASNYAHAVSVSASETRQLIVI
jgi:hypothetical protein